jgi:hypothetical protein
MLTLETSARIQQSLKATSTLTQDLQVGHHLWNSPLQPIWLYFALFTAFTVNSEIQKVNSIL